MAEGRAAMGHVRRYLNQMHDVRLGRHDECVRPVTRQMGLDPDLLKLQMSLLLQPHRAERPAFYAAELNASGPNSSPLR